MSVVIDATTAARITGARNWHAVRAHYPARVDAMAAGLTVGDPAADAVIAAMSGDPGFTWRQIVAALDGEPGTGCAGAPPPQPVADFLDAVATPPPWFDPALARAGAEAWWRFGSLQSSTLYQSLMYGYQARGFTEPLVRTGRLTDGTWDRVQATARWVTVATAPGMMEPGQPGWQESVRIRLVHAMVRHHLYTREGWDDASYGVPINQTYQQLTITAGFLVLPLLVAKDFGIRYSAADLEAICHLWRWIGWVMGVSEPLLPNGLDDARLTYRIAREFRMQPDAESKVLVRALLADGYRVSLGLPGPLDDAAQLLSGPFLRALFSSVSSRWVDHEVAAEMGLRATPLHRLVDVARPLIRSRELARALGLLGSEQAIARRELRLVTNRLGIDLDAPGLGSRYRSADRGRLDTVA
ncbi:hypothetical protein GCM10009624_19810 [Gordonia sinesedis]